MNKIMDDLYDLVFKNTHHSIMNFCAEYPDSWIDRDTDTIHLANKKTLFKIKIERVNDL